MQFEWDDSKAQVNFRKHGIRFEDAIRIFDNPVVTMDDDRFDYGEARSISIGMLGAAAVLLVVHVDRNGFTRIISARRATPRERRMYDDQVEKS
jgi:uncharacterized protein